VTQNPKNGDLVGHNGFGNPLFGSEWVHFVKFSWVHGGVGVWGCEFQNCYEIS
jgi:hypothetical protein